MELSSSSDDDDGGGDTSSGETDEEILGAPTAAPPPPRSAKKRGRATTAAAPPRRQRAPLSFRILHLDSVDDFARLERAGVAKNDADDDNDEVTCAYPKMIYGRERNKSLFFCDNGCGLFAKKSR